MNEDILINYKNLAFLGRQYPHEYIATLADDVLITLADWLRSNGCPSQAIEMVSDLAMLERCAQGLKHSDLTDWDASYLIESLPGVAHRIAELGGEFQSAAGAYPARPDVIRWKPADAEEYFARKRR